MQNNLRNFLSARKKQKFAIETGVQTHSKMQRIVIDDDTEQGAPELINKIKSNPTLLPLFSRLAKTEVPIAGIVKGKFISRRLDRMLIQKQTKEIIFLDYKTDINKNTFREKYIFQMREYIQLLKNIYPDYSIKCFILWLHDFETEQIF